MKQINNEGNIYIIKEIKEKEKINEINLEHISLDKKNLLGKINNIFNFKLDSLYSQYLYNKIFPDNSFILIGLSSIQLYPNLLENTKNILSTKISFNYDKQYKIKSYHLSQNKYLIINGKTIILLEKNGKLLISKTYNKLNNMSIISVIGSEEEKDKFSGFLIRIKCLVSYENTNNKQYNKNINIQNFVLPQFENEIIIDFRIIYFNLDENGLYKIFKNKIVIFLNKKIIYYYSIKKDNKQINKLKDFENELVDYIKIIDDYLLVFYNNTNINIYKINLSDESEIILIRTVKYNKNKRIILKRKVFYDKKEDLIYVYYIDYSLEQSFFCFNLLNINDIEIKEEKLNKENKYYSPSNYYKKKVNKTIIGYVNNKHSIIFGKSFYNKIIINYKIYNDEECNKNLILLLTHQAEIEIYNFDLTNKKIKNILYIIHLDYKYNEIIDFLMINENYLLLLNVNSEKNILELNQLHLILNEDCFEGKKECLLECKMAYNNLYYLKELNLLFISSNYGEISVYNIDSRANIEFINSFNYGYSSCEIIKIKNSLNENDFSKLFIYDLLKHRLKTFDLIDIYHLLKYKENELFYFHLMIFLYKECFLLFIIMENKYTCINKVLFGKQIKNDKNIFNNIKEPFKFILENLAYDIETHSFDFTLPIQNN